MRPGKIVAFVVLALLLSGCQTNMLKEFDDVKAGMDKDDVLNIMGSPRSTQRFHGKDRWRYTIYNSNMRYEKEVHFKEGLAVYVGEPWEPPTELSAAVVDQKNEELNNKIDQMLKDEAQSSKTNFDAYQSKVKGEDKVRYLPEFKGVD